MNLNPRNSLPLSYRKPVPSSHSQVSLPLNRPASSKLPVTPVQGDLSNPYEGFHKNQVSPQGSLEKGWTETKAYHPVPDTREVDNIDASPSTPDRVSQSMPPLIVAHHRTRLFWWALRYFLIVVIIFVALLIPIVTLSNDAEFAEDSSITSIEQKQYRNLVFYICLWLEVTWVAAVFFDCCINENELLAVNVNKDPDTLAWDDVLADVLEQAALWVAFYFVEKLMISYISVHYHYRNNQAKLTHTKEVHNALIALYDASVYLHPIHSGAFDEEDIFIRNAKGDMHSSGRARVTSYLARLGIDGYKMTNLFGNFISDDPSAHWLRPASSYSVVERSWADPKSATALARRIWLSLAAKGSPGLTVDDLCEVLGPYRKAEAAKIFKTLNENQSHDIRLEDFIGIVTEAGKSRHDIYRNISSMDHCINTFDWFCLFIIAAVMIFFIMIAYVPAIKQIQTILSSLAIGLSFAVGRTFHHLLVGIVFVFFDHPFDIGDVVNVYNPGSTAGTACVVKKQSLLYTLFRRLDNNCDLQISNERLSLKRIENYSRSGINRQGLSLFVDFRTSFKDIMRLRGTLEDFMAKNSRDYVPDSLALNIVSLHELNKMELRLAFTHRNNWSDDRLRSQRSNRFHCALVAACRAIPLYKPGSMLPTAGENGNPMYTVQLSTTTELADNIKTEKDRRQGLRWDDGNKDLHREVDTSLSDAELTKRQEVVESDRKKAATMVEEEAFRKLAKLPTAVEQAAASTGVDIEVPSAGLRHTTRQISR
ncbi:putative MscS family protein C1183.11-like protein 3 [Colletotrichum chlorophyti]|uniref:Putative MscS family protein C1183.11-like protein 3 n=1 Tax=Colletotrichum chlorophyti TaxID=708187 RepID=A0A1Q8RNV2_9PEZI|nr:putative MscS family protein C1183.11-like protein 3 [Colletotrichum chlorophyti]